jgi:hypothetical protein
MDQVNQDTSKKIGRTSGAEIEIREFASGEETP